MKQIQLGTKEFYEMMNDFERLNITNLRKDKENKEEWAKGRYYQHGEVNQIFKIFLMGVNYGIKSASL